MATRMMLEPGWIGSEPWKMHEGLHAVHQPGSHEPQTIEVVERGRETLFYSVEDGVTFAHLRGDRIGFVGGN